MNNNVPDWVNFLVNDLKHPLAWEIHLFLEKQFGTKENPLKIIKAGEFVGFLNNSNLVIVIDNGILNVDSMSSWRILRFNYELDIFDLKKLLGLYLEWTYSDILKQYKVHTILPQNDLSLRYILNKY